MLGQQHIHRIVHSCERPIERLRQREFARLDEQGLAYLDYTGAALYGVSQIRAHTEWLMHHVLGNPHAEHEASAASTDAIERAKRQTLAFFAVDESTHELCFTANASAAIKLVGESFRFSNTTPLVLSCDNHNSVIGIRDYAKRQKAPVHYLPLDASLRLDHPESALHDFPAQGGGLLAFPAQSNFSGVVHPLTLIEQAQRMGFRVLLDAAAYVGSHALDLHRHPADFVALSFYKLFGYPTGIGALIARRDALQQLRRPWFAGGTVDYVSVAHDRQRLRNGAAGFADGTPNFLDIASLRHGFDLLEEVGMPAITTHVERLTQRLLQGLSELHHANGVAKVQIYGPLDTTARGGTVAFNLVNEERRVVAYEPIERAAKTAKIALRSGCFCNPGAAETVFGLTDSEFSRCLDQLNENFSIARLGECIQRPLGALRASLGLANSAADVERLLHFLAEVH